MDVIAHARPFSRAMDDTKAKMRRRYRNSFAAAVANCSD
jgi:hypothetical protein